MLQHFLWVSNDVTSDPGSQYHYGRLAGAFDPLPNSNPHPHTHKHTQKVSTMLIVFFIFCLNHHGWTKGSMDGSMDGWRDSWMDGRRGLL